MAENGWSPATRVFEAAGAGACLITDAWEGIGDFLEPGAEVLVAEERTGVAALVDSFDPAAAVRIGQQAARRVLAHHTYAHRDEQVDGIFRARAMTAR